MTNNYYIVDGPDGEPSLCHKQIKIRGYYTQKIIELVEEESWEEAAKKVCRYCGGYIEAEDEHTDIEHICYCTEEKQDPSTPHVPV